MTKDRRPVAAVASAAAVVISLIFVGLEVRESARQTEINTQSLQLNAYQDLIAQIQVVNLTLLDNSDLRIRMNENSESAWENLSPEDAGEFTAFFYVLLRHGDLAFYQYELGMLTEERLLSALAPLGGQICRPLFGEFWENGARESFSEGYRRLIDERFSATGVC